MTNHRPIELTERDKKRFWIKVVKAGPDECWTWNAGHFNDGYPQFSIGYQSHRANRVSYVIANGPLQIGQQVNHRCDNKKCINPKHLYAGTQLENMHDMDRRGRKVIAFGLDRGHCKLNPDSVREIRLRYALGGISHERLAKDYQVSRRAVSKVIARDCWAHVQ